MIRYKENKEKSIAVMLYVLKELHHSDIHKLFKIIYFADKEHLLRFGKPITGDWYVAMKDGPVPSHIYDYIKIVRGEIDIKDDALLASFEVKNGFMIYPKADPEMDELTKVEMECLNKSIEENNNLGYNDLVDKSHDSAYRKADRNNIISYEDMAISAGANEELIKYIISTAENKALSLR